MIEDDNIEKVDMNNPHAREYFSWETERGFLFYGIATMRKRIVVEHSIRNDSCLR